MNEEGIELDSAQEIFDAMVNNHGVDPNEEHVAYVKIYENTSMVIEKGDLMTCIVTALARADEFGKASISTLQEYADSVDHVVKPN